MLPRRFRHIVRECLELGQAEGREAEHAAALGAALGPDRAEIDRRRGGTASAHPHREALRGARAAVSGRSSASRYSILMGLC